jgi:mono/diheme cytochrome c family protein
MIQLYTNMKPALYSLLISPVLLVVLLSTPKLVAKPAATSNPRSASQLYAKYCVSCHGQNGKSQTPKGKSNHARDLTDAKWQDDVSDERIYNSIMNGRKVRGEMPSFSNKLSNEEADSLVGLVRGLRK